MTPPEAIRALSRRELGRMATLALALGCCAAIAWLFRDPLLTYRLHSDDFAYFSASRTLDRALENLFRAHNTHIVPTWRLLTWAIVAIAGRLANLQPVLAAVSFGTLVLVLLTLERLIEREMGRAWFGLAALVVAGTTSVMKSSATWYSSGQTLWASLAILLMLCSLQSWRREGGWWRLAAAACFCWLAGSFWTIGHAAGPTGAAYLWGDRRRRCRLASLVPLSATALSIAVALTLGGRYINAKVSFHGRTEREAANPAAGLTHTMQAIPEDLLCNNVGVECETDIRQATVLTFLLVALWLWSLARRGPPTPLEYSGVVLLSSSYFVEWTFRGYLPFSSLRGIVPWYDTIPHVGLILLGFGWLARHLKLSCQPVESRAVKRLRIGQAAGLVALQGLLLLVHQPRVDRLFINDVPQLTVEQQEVFVTPELQLARARYFYAPEYARLQRHDLAKLDEATHVARRLDIGRKAIARAFGRIDMLELPNVYDAIGFLDVREDGRQNDPVIVRRALGELLTPSPPPRLSLQDVSERRVAPASP